MEVSYLSHLFYVIVYFYNSLSEFSNIFPFTFSGISVELVGKQVKVSPDMAIFITMNPGYAGRSNLPDNLKKLFRSLAMTTPDRQLIAEVMLFSQGFRQAEKLACKIVPFFRYIFFLLKSSTITILKLLKIPIPNRNTVILI